LIGAPGDLGAGKRGAAHGPAALRAAGLAQALRESGLPVVDWDDIQGPESPDNSIVAGCRHLHAIALWCRGVYRSVGLALATGHLPLLLGGDHSLSIGSVAAVARHCADLNKYLSVVWLDAHADFNTPETTPTGNVHGMPVAIISGQGPSELTDLGHGVPMLEVSRIRLVGVRSVDDAEKLRARARGLRIYGMDEIQCRGMSSVMTEVLEGVSRYEGHLHLSFDVDFLDPLVAPGVGTREPGGPDLTEAEVCLSMIGATGVLGSIDVMEFNPLYDRDFRTANGVVSLMKALFLSVAERAAEVEVRQSPRGQ
jgi:arginase